MKLTGYTISEFAKLTNNETKNTDSTIYGTVKWVNEKLYVKIDGSEFITPAVTESEVREGERVSVQIQNHSAVVTGNSSNPSCSVGTVEENYSEFAIEKDVIYAKVGDIEGNMAEITLRADELSTRVTDAEGSISSFTQRADEIDLKVDAKVDSDSIISSINLSKEGIKISADKVAITGVVTFEDLKTPGKTTISGSNITSGKITGTRLQTAELTSTTGVAIETNSVKIGSASLFFNKGRFDIQCSQNIAVASMGNITIMPGLRQDGTSTDTGQVNIPQALLNVQRLTVVNNAIVQGNLSVSGKLSCGSFSPSSVSTESVSCSSVSSSGTVTGYDVKATRNMNCVDMAASGNISVSGTAWIKTLYVNGTAVTSDARLKTDIKYVDSDIQTIGDSGWMAPNVNINKSDMFEFIEALPIASYRYKEDVDKGVDETHYGFIVQDVVYTKVGSELVKVLDEDKQVGDEGDIMGYSPEKLIVFMCGALQEEIKARKALEEYIRNRLS